MSSPSSKNTSEMPMNYTSFAYKKIAKANYKTEEGIPSAVERANFIQVTAPCPVQILAYDKNVEKDYKFKCPMDIMVVTDQETIVIPVKRTDYVFSVKHIKQLDSEEGSLSAILHYLMKIKKMSKLFEADFMKVKTNCCWVWDNDTKTALRLWRSYKNGNRIWFEISVATYN
eukprot:g10554.t1